MRLRPVRKHLEESLPIRRKRADRGKSEVRTPNYEVQPVRQSKFVIRHCHRAGLLQLDDHQRQAVDEADRGKSEVRSPNYEVQSVRQSKLVIRHFLRAGDAELADQQEIIVRRLLPINHAQPLRLLPAAHFSSPGRCRSEFKDLKSRFPSEWILQETDQARLSDVGLPQCRP